MYDVFDILVRDLDSKTIEMRRPKTPFGPDARLVVYSNGRAFAEVRDPRTARATVERWVEAGESTSWTLLDAREFANNALTDETSWEAFLAALVAALAPHEAWHVLCESDCEQHPLQAQTLSPEELASALRRLRSEKVLPIAFHATTR